jgi:pilus assembly protein CpaB
MKARIPLIAAIVLGAIAALAVYNYMASVRREAYRGLKPVAVLGARVNIPQGTALAGHITTIMEIPEKYVSSQNIVIRKKADFEVIRGQRTVRALIKAGEPIYWSDIGGERVGGLAALITLGERGISIPVDNIAAVSCLIEANDHVDILGTFTTTMGGSGGEVTEAELSTFTLLQNVTILAVGQQIGGRGADLGRRALGLGGSGYSSVTISVTPLEAEFLIFAQQQGKISLALRNPEDLSAEEIPEVNFRTILDKLDELRKDRTDRIEKISGKKMEVIE